MLERKPCLRLDHRAPLAAIGLWENAWRVLDVLGAGEQLRAAHLRLSRVELTSAEGKLLRSFGFNECDADARAGPGGSEFRGVRRAALLEALAAQLPPGCIQYGMEVERISEEGGGAGAAGAAAAAAGAGSSSSGAPAAPVLHLAGGRRLRCRALVGADGARSVVARHLGLAAPNYSGYTAYRGVATFPEGGLPLPPDTIRQVRSLVPLTMLGGLFGCRSAALALGTCPQAKACLSITARAPDILANICRPDASWGSMD